MSSLSAAAAYIPVSCEKEIFDRGTHKFRRTACPPFFECIKCVQIPSPAKERTLDCVILRLGRLWLQGASSRNLGNFRAKLIL